MCLGGVKMDYQQFNKHPVKIEKNSMEIIEEEMKDPSRFSEEELKVIKRVIHTTADFEYEDFTVFSKEPIEAFLSGLEDGLPIISDTNMIRAGINKRALKEFGSELHCYVSDEAIINKATETGMTRSRLGMDHAASQFDEALFVYGNAPTALARILELAEENKIRPRAIIGVPVGFVGALESKELLHTFDIPHITTLSRKGGSNVAVSIVNAIMYMSKESK